MLIRWEREALEACETDEQRRELMQYLAEEEAERLELLREDFCREFASAVDEHDREIQTICEGAPAWISNNFISFWTWLTPGVDQRGEGCQEWGEWMNQWCGAFEERMEDESGRCDDITIYRLHFYPVSALGVNRVFVHQVIAIRFGDGTRILLDPWRSKECPITDYDEYMEEGDYQPLNGFSGEAPAFYESGRAVGTGSFCRGPLRPPTEIDQSCFLDSPNPSAFEIYLNAEYYWYWCLDAATGPAISNKLGQCAALGSLCVSCP